MREPEFVSAAVAAALGIPQAGGGSVIDSVTAVLAWQQLLLVLDSCEHVARAVAELCAGVLAAADDVRILATSREPVGVAGEARYRPPPLSLPLPAGSGGSEAVALFADRAHRADAHFALTGATGPVVARLVARLDGMPLAIELAAARVESLGVAQLLERLDDRFALLTGADRRAAARHRSLEAAVEWSYQLLGEQERRVFRQLAVFPGPFTLEGAEAVAGEAAGPAVLHLVDCSLLAPPQAGPDGRARYLMLETLRAYGLERLAEAGEQSGAVTALARHALQVAEQAAALIQASAGELAAARWLDAEEATVHQGLAWALEHDRAGALRLAIALAPWWMLRGRELAGYPLLRAAAEHAVPGEDAWCAAQLWLGQEVIMTTDLAGALDHFTAVRDAVTDRGASTELARALALRSVTLVNLDRTCEGAEDAARALAVARETGDLAAEAMALWSLSGVAYYTDDPANSLTWARQAQRIDPASIPGWLARLCGFLAAIALFEAGETAAAERSCADGLARAQEACNAHDQADFLWLTALLDHQAGRLADAGMHLQEAIELASRIGDGVRLIDCLDSCGHLCAATGRRAEAITIWAARTTCQQRTGLTVNLPQDERRRREPMRKAAQALGPARTQAAEERGAAMTLVTAAEFATMLTAPRSQQAQAPLGPGRLSARERELVTLVARGRTDTQIAAQLYISVRTVRSHLDRIRDKSGCRRRADLTRLALQTGLV